MKKHQYKGKIAILTAVLVILGLASFSGLSSLFEGNLSQLTKRVPNVVASPQKPKNVIVDENGKVQNGSGGSLGQYADNSDNFHKCEKGFWENNKKIWSYCEGEDFVKTITLVNGNVAVNSLKSVIDSPDSFIRKIQNVGVEYVASDPQNHTFQGKYTTVSEVVGYIGMSLSKDNIPNLLFAMDPYYNQNSGCGGSDADGYNAPCYLAPGVLAIPVSELNNMQTLNIVLKNNEIIRLENFEHNFQELNSQSTTGYHSPGLVKDPSTQGRSN